MLRVLCVSGFTQCNGIAIINIIVRYFILTVRNYLLLTYINMRVIVWCACCVATSFHLSVQMYQHENQKSEVDFDILYWRIYEKLSGLLTHSLPAI